MARNKYHELAPKYKRRKQLALLKTSAGCLFLLLPFVGIPGAFIAYSSIRSHYLRTEGIVTKGVIIDDKNYFGNSHVSHDFSYSYRFVVNGHDYIGDSRDSHYSVGQGILVKYAAHYPRFNEAYKPE